MTDTEPTVDKVIELMNAMVAKDGGKVRLASFSADEKRLTVDYHMGINQECATCSITPELVQVFMTESLENHGLPGVDVLVQSVD